MIIRFVILELIMNINPKYITDKDGNKTSVIISLQEFENLLEMADDLEDVKLYDKAKKGPQVFREAEEVFKEIDQKKYN